MYTDYEDNTRVKPNIPLNIVFRLIKMKQREREWGRGTPQGECILLLNEEKLQNHLVQNMCKARTGHSWPFSTTIAIERERDFQFSLFSTGA